LIFCQGCGRVMPEGAQFCPHCGASAPAVLTQPQVAVSEETTGFMAPPPERKRSLFSGRNFLVVVIGVLIVLLVGATLETGALTGTSGGNAINTPLTPFSGSQLYRAYAFNSTQAATDYNNRTLYVKDSIDTGVNQDFDGRYYSTMNLRGCNLVNIVQTQTTTASVSVNSL
jgi:hypothetical protein